MLKSISQENISEKSFVQKSQEFTNDNFSKRKINKGKFEPKLKQESDFEKFSNLVSLIEKV